MIRFARIVAVASTALASPSLAQEQPPAAAEQTVEERIEQSIFESVGAPPADALTIGIESQPEEGADASMADPTSSLRLPTPLDAADIEQRIDKGLTAAGEESALRPDYAYAAFQRGYFLTAFARALARAEQGDATAQTLLGELLSRGLGVKQDLAAAADWYRLAATGGDAEAQYALGRMYLEGQAVAQDIEKAAELFAQAAGQLHPVAAREFAYLLLQGRGRPQNLMLAAAYFRRAAALGDMDAQYSLAGLYVEGIGVVHNGELAARWFGEAARNGHVAAQVEYAILLFNGRGVTADQPQAVRWFREAAAADNPVAQVRLARILADGEGVEADSGEAARWYLIARSRGVEDEYMDQWLESLDDATVQAATEAAASWIGADVEPQHASAGAEPMDNPVE